MLPYYLHQLDRVSGAHHFFVPEEKAKLIMQQCYAQLPGYLVPRYVVERPGAMSKLPIMIK